MQETRGRDPSRAGKTRSQRAAGDAARIGARSPLAGLAGIAGIVAQASVAARDSERARIGRELHDGPAQVVGSVRMQLSRLAERHPDLGLERIVDDLGGAFRAIRLASHALLAPDIDGAGLPAALARLALGLGRAAGFPVACDVEDPRGRLPAGVARQLHRIASEVCANIARHAAATRASIRLAFEGACVVLEVSDDGRGLPDRSAPDAQHEGVGLAGLRERARAIGARLTIESEPGRGTRVRVALATPDHTSCSGPLAADGRAQTTLGRNS